MEEKVFRSQQI